jgi:carboxymethylenebutenolidase
MTTNETYDIQTHRIELKVSDGTTMPAYVARPTATGSHPGLLVFQEAFGVNAHIRDVTERFARAGYTALAPALFHRTDPNFEGSYTEFGAAMPHMQAVTDEGLIVDIQASYAWLTAEDGGKAKSVGSVGYCMGGRVSFLTDAVVPVQASASYYGGGIAPNPRRPHLLKRVPDLHAPILFFWGGKDQGIPPDQIRAVEDALIEAGKPYEQVTFSDAEHGFFCDVRAGYNEVASRQAWALTLAFFACYL